MKNLSSWLIVIFIIMYWLFRVIVAVMGSMALDFITKPIDNNIEIALLFIVLACVPFIFKRKLIGAIVYLISYGWYFGRGLMQNTMQLINGETLKFNQEYYNKYNKIVAVSDSAKEVLEPTAPVATATDSAQAAPVADSAKVAETAPVEQPTETEEQVAPRETTATAGKTIMENPWEFLVVSVLFIATTIAIIFTGKD